MPITDRRFYQRKLECLANTIKGLNLEAKWLQQSLAYGQFKQGVMRHLVAFAAERRSTLAARGVQPLPDAEVELKVSEDREEEASLLLQQWQDLAASAANLITCRDATPPATAVTEVTDSSSDGNTASCKPEPVPSSPHDDPFALCRSVLQTPAWQAAQSVTMEDLMERYAHLVGQMAVALNRHETGLADQTERMEALVRKVLHLKASLIVMRRPAMVMAMALTNYETGETLQEPDRQHTLAVLSKLGLSQQQRTRIAQGKAVFGELLAPVLAELQQLQRQCTNQAQPNMHQQGEQASSGTSQHQQSSGQQQQQQQSVWASDDTQQEQQQQQHGDGRCTDAPEQALPGTSSGSAQQHMHGQPDDSGMSQQQRHEQHSAGTSQPQPFKHGAQLQEQRQLQRRIKLLLHKDAFLRSLGGAFTMGTLSWLQLTKLYVLSSPYAPHAQTITILITEQAQQEQQAAEMSEQQQQQPQEAAAVAAAGAGSKKKARSKRSAASKPAS